MISVLKSGWPHYVLTGAIMSGGDAIAQKFFEEKETFDFKRNARFAALGAIFVVIICLIIWIRSYFICFSVVPSFESLV